MRTVALASGSNGNSVYVETRDARLLFDAGLSGKALAARAAARGVDLDGLDGLLLSHNHSDHVSGAGVIHRRHGVPIHATRGTWAAIQGRMGRVKGVSTYAAGAEHRFGRTVVRTIPTPHDGADGVAFVIEDAGVRLGVLTDLGHPFGALIDTLGTLDAAYLEANYDPVMLTVGPYPYHLKERIEGPGGHLSNEECVALAADASGGRLRHLVLCHLSGENTPGQALHAAEGLMERGVEVTLAPRTGPSDVLQIEG